MLVREILKSAKPPSILPAKSGEAKLIGEVYGDMAHDMVANQISQSGQLGMRSALSRQLALKSGLNRTLKKHFNLRSRDPRSTGLARFTRSGGFVREATVQYH